MNLQRPTKPSTRLDPAPFPHCVRGLRLVGALARCARLSPARFGAVASLRLGGAPRAPGCGSASGARVARCARSAAPWRPLVLALLAVTRAALRAVTVPRCARRPFVRAEPGVAPCPAEPGPDRRRRSLPSLTQDFRAVWPRGAGPCTRHHRNGHLAGRRAGRGFPGSGSHTITTSVAARGAAPGSACVHV